MENIKDYLHLYLGAKCQIADSNKVDYIRMVNETGLSVCTGTNTHGIQIWYKSNVCKLILRPLSDMSEDEQYKLNMFDTHKAGVFITDVIKSEAEKVRWLLSKHFDLFGLIEACIAIDATTLNQVTTPTP